MRARLAAGALSAFVAGHLISAGTSVHKFFWVIVDGVIATMVHRQQLPILCRQKARQEQAQLLDNALIRNGWR